MLGLVCCVLALMLSRARRVAIALIAVAHVGLLVIARAGICPTDRSRCCSQSDPHSEKAIVEAGHVVARRARFGVEPARPPRRAPRARRARQRLGVFTDGMSPTYMVEEARAKAGAFETTWGLLMSLPYRALHPERVLVLGAGAGASVWLAKKYGASRVDAVEVNPAIPACSRAGSTSPATCITSRAFACSSRTRAATSPTPSERYDLIELALALTGNAHAQPVGDGGAPLHGRGGAAVPEPPDADRRRSCSSTAIRAMRIASCSRCSRRSSGRRPARARARRHRRAARSAARHRVSLHARRSHVADAARRRRRARRRAGGAAVGPGRSAGAQRRSCSIRKQLGATDARRPVAGPRRAPVLLSEHQGPASRPRSREPGRLWVLAGALLLVLVLIVERRARCSRVRAPRSGRDGPRRRVSVRRARADPAVHARGRRNALRGVVRAVQLARVERRRRADPRRPLAPSRSRRVVGMPRGGARRRRDRAARARPRVARRDLERRRRGCC